jgi:hypothetical protein
MIKYPANPIFPGDKMLENRYTSPTNPPSQHHPGELAWYTQGAQGVMITVIRKRREVDPIVVTNRVRNGWRTNSFNVLWRIACNVRNVPTMKVRIIEPIIEPGLPSNCTPMRQLGSKKRTKKIESRDSTTPTSNCTVTGFRATKIPKWSSTMEQLKLPTKRIIKNMATPRIGGMKIALMT